MFRKVLVAMAAIAMMASLTGTADAGNSLSTRQIRALFPGTFSAVVKSINVRLVASRSGHLKGSAYGLTDRGRWSVRRGVLCIVLYKWMDSKPRCSRVRRSGGWYRVANVRFRRM